MAKAAITIAVIAFCAFVADGQYYPYETTPDSFYPYTDDYVTHPPPTSQPVATLKVCNEDADNLNHRRCDPLKMKDHSCHNLQNYDFYNWDDRVRSVDTLGPCVHLFEHKGCRGQRITVGQGCYNVGCCPHSGFLSKCNFANKMSAFMIC